MDKELERRIEQREDYLHAHGYAVLMSPVAGQEDKYAEALRLAIEKIANTLQFQAKQYKYKGLSKAALQSLHKTLPEPGWGIKLK